LADVWETARQAMMAAALNSVARPFSAEWIEYEQIRDARGGQVISQRVRTTRALTAHAFRSVPAAVLAREGFVQDDGGDAVYFAPDLMTLLSEEFAGTHCLRLVAHEGGDERLIGVAFEPAGRARGRRDITGRFWIDRGTAELRFIEFGYTNVPVYDDGTRASGRIDFVHLATGEWLVERWYIVTPRVGNAPQGVQLRTGTTVATARPQVQGFQETGGWVARVRRQDTLVYAARERALVAQITTDGKVLGTSGAMLRLEGTDYEATADSGGRLRLLDVLPGRYRARLHTPLMDSLGMSPVLRMLTVRPTDTLYTLYLPSGDEVMAHACGGKAAHGTSGMLRGRLRGTNGAAIASVAVTAMWQGASESDPRRTDGRAGAVATLSDSLGLWMLCGIPRGRSLRVRAQGDEWIAVGETVIVGDRLVETVALNPAVAGAVGPRETDADPGLLEVSTVTADGRALPDVEVTVLPADGRDRVLRTNDRGRAVAVNLQPGDAEVRTRRVGFRPGRVRVAIARGRNTVPIILSAAAAPILDTVRILGNRRVSARLDEFETRRMRREATVSLTTYDIDRRQATETWELLSGLAGVRVVRDVGEHGVFAVSARGGGIEAGGSKVAMCFLAVFLNGLPVSSGAAKAAYDLTLLPRPELIYGIEVFAGGATLPPRLAGAVAFDRACGAIAIWEK